MAQTEENPYVRRNEFRQLQGDVRQMAHNVNHLVKSLDSNVATLVDAIAGKTPEGFVPMGTHKMVIRWMAGSFTLVLIAIVGAREVLPMLLGFIR